MSWGVLSVMVWVAFSLFFFGRERVGGRMSGGKWAGLSSRRWVCIFEMDTVDVLDQG